MVQGLSIWMGRTCGRGLSSLPARYYPQTHTIQARTQHSVDRKTDIVLYPTIVTKKNPKGIRLNKGRCAWKDVLVVGELKPTSKKPSDLIIQLAGYVREIFYVQLNRRFAHAFTLAGDLLRTWIFRRGGGFGSASGNVRRCLCRLRRDDAGGAWI